MVIMLYDVHVIKQNARGNFLDLDDDFKQLNDGLHIVLNRWNDVQCRNTAQLIAKRETCEELIAHLETLLTVVKRAEENAESEEFQIELEREARFLEDYIRRD